LPGEIAAGGCTTVDRDTAGKTLGRERETCLDKEKA